MTPLFSGNVKIITDKPTYAPGEVIRFSATVKFDKPTKARGVFAYLVCRETKREQISSYMTDDEVRWKQELGEVVTNKVITRQKETRHEPWHIETKVAGQGYYKDETFSGQIRIPQTATPTSYEFGHDNKINIWYLKIKVDIPMALDINAEKEILIRGLSIH